MNRLQQLAGLNEAEATSAPAAPAANAPSDVKALGKAQTTATTVSSKAKAINSINEFSGAFENWFKTLGFQPGKVSKSAVRSAVEKILTNLGYK
jgi:polyisoprenoid-binding protein YceI